MIKPCKAFLLGFAFLFGGVAAGTAAANDVFTAHLSGDGMILMSKLPIFDPEVPGKVIGFSDYQSSIPTGATGKLVLRLTEDGGIHYRTSIKKKNDSKIAKELSLKRYVARG